MTLLATPISATPVPSPKRAVTIGRAIAHTEANAISSTTIAAPSPIAVAEPSDACSVSAIACPPSSTSSCGDAIAWAVSMTFWVASLGSDGASSSKLTVAKPIPPPSATAPAPRSYGLPTSLTCGSRATSRNIALTRARTPASCSEPPRTRKTIRSLSPDWAGNSRLSRSTVRWDSVPGAEARLTKSLPNVSETAEAPTSTVSQSKNTAPRCRPHQRARPTSMLGS